MYKQIFSAIALPSLVLMTACSPSSQPDAFAEAFAQADSMAQTIVVPEFCSDTFNVVTYGARPDADALTNAAAIQAAIDSANVAGGGCVLVPQGEFLTGPIELKSNVNLVVAKDAKLLFSTDYEHYLPAVLTRWEGVDCYNLRPLIYANNAKNIAITGEGVIDGQGSNEVWWYMKGHKKYGWHEGLISQGTKGRPRLLASDRQQMPVNERVMGIEDGLRPQLINICRSENVLIEGVTLRNSPFWVIHPLFVDNLTVKGVHIESHGPNSDGCDPESCKNVLIEDCYFDTGDDCIAIKSGRNYDGRRHAAASENIYVRNCRMKNGHGGVVLGSEISGGFRNLWIENCQMSSPDLERVIRIKTNSCRGGVIENIFVRNVEVGECQEAILKVNLDYEPDEDCDRGFVPTVRNVNLKNVTSQKSEYGVYVIGLDSLVNVQGIRVEDCNFDGVERGNSIRGAEDVEFSGLHINGEIVSVE